MTENLALKWFIDNKAALSFVPSDLCPSGTNLDIMCDITSNFDGDILDIHDIDVVVLGELRTCPPFRFGSIDSLSFSGTSEAMQKLVTSSLNIRKTLSVTAKPDSLFNMADITNKLIEAKSIGSTYISLGDRYNMCQVTGFMYGIQNLSKSGNFEKLLITIDNVIIKIQKPTNDVNIRVVSVDSQDGDPRQQCEIVSVDFTNIMDLQEWLFDNKLEHLL